jgi:hypothetical protein
MKDARIIAEIGRRKAMKDAMFDMEVSPTIQISWEGDLESLQFMGIDQTQIVSIEQVSPGVWLVTYRE